MYQCEPYKDYNPACSNDNDCGRNEYCAPLVAECRTKLPDGSICIAERECLNHCGGGVCSNCLEGIRNSFLRLPLHNIQYILSNDCH